MRLSKRVLDDIIIEAIGPDVLPLVHKLKGKKDVSEMVLSKAVRKDINEVRNMLYRLHNFNLVSFSRKRDQKKGWYVYFWSLNKKSFKHLIAKIKKQQLTKLVDRLKREKETDFFVCTNKCARIPFESALSIEFKCPECGALLIREENPQFAKQIKEQIKQLEIELKEVA